MRRTIGIAVVLLLVAPWIALATSDSEPGTDMTIEVNRSGFPIVSEQITLKGFGRLDPQHQPWDTMTMLQDYEELTNIRIEWETPAKDNASERKNLAMVSQDMPDFFIKSVLTSNDLIRFGSDGALMQLEGLIDEWAPNLKPLLDANPDWRLGMTAPDGHIYGLPRILPFLPQRVYKYPLMNVAWLDRLGLDPPDTSEELYDVLAAFRDQDANGNGDPNDEIPYSAHKWVFLLKDIMGMYGVIEEIGKFDFRYPTRIEGETVHIQIADPEFKEALEYYALLYQDGLVDRDIFSHTRNESFGKLAAGRYGYTPIYQPRNAGEYANEFDAIVPPAGPEGDRYWNWLNPDLNGVNTFSITSTNAYPEATMRWVDYFYSDDGVRRLKLVSEEFYDELADGSIQMKDFVLNAEEGMTNFMGRHTFAPGGNSPGYFIGRYIEPEMGGTPMLSYIDKVSAHIPQRSVTMPLLSAEDQQRMSEIRSDLDTYVDEMWAKLVVGDESFDDWSDYVDTINRMGLQEMEEIIARSLFRN